MAIPLNINGAVFEYPENFDEGWGINATGWAQAVTNGMLQRAGGNFPLTADANFGASFGLVSLYYKSRLANIATTGTMRLASADPGIAFRNNANNGDLVLTTNSSDNLIYPDGLELSGTLLLHNDNAVGFQDTGSVHTINMKSPSTTANYTFTLPPNAGSNGQVLSTNGSGTTTWINAAGGGTINSGTQYQLAYYATTGTTISGDSFITTNASNQLLATDGTASLPGYSFSADTDAGLYRVGTDDIALVTNGINRLEITPTIIASTLPIDLGSNKISGLANGLSAQEAAAIGQVQYAFQNAVQLVYAAGPYSITSTSYAATAIVASITPTSSTSRIKITVSIDSLLYSVGPGQGHITVFRNSGDIAPNANGFISFSPNVTNASYPGGSFTVIDSPTTTSPVTYSVRAKTTTGTFIVSNFGGATPIILEELR